MTLVGLGWAGAEPFSAPLSLTLRGGHPVFPRSPNSNSGSLCGVVKATEKNAGAGGPHRAPCPRSPLHLRLGEEPSLTGSCPQAGRPLHRCPLHLGARAGAVLGPPPPLAPDALPPLGDGSGKPPHVGREGPGGAL